MLQAGQVIAGRYRLDSPIGEGAMAAVWCAEDQTLKRQVAIKFLFVRGTRDPQAMVDQFLREARIAASVQHRNVIQTVDFGTFDDHQPFMVMELLSGESLGDRMERDPPLTREQVVHLVSLTLRGLSAVHEAGIVHRDLKPHNIFLQRDADAVYPKILDFGISRSLQQGEERPSAIATQEGMIVGTPDYMAPEQARGEANIDRRADIYGMGVILYEGLTGQLPFMSDNIGDLIVKIVTEEPPAANVVAPEVPPGLSSMIAQAMAKDRAHRFADARAMRAALLSAAEQSLPPSRRAAVSQPAPAPGAGNLSATGDGLQLDVAAPGIAAQRGPSPPGAPGGDVTWGDFEGLASSKMLDVSPPPVPSGPAGQSGAPPRQKRIQAHAPSDTGGGSLELAAGPLDGLGGPSPSAPTRSTPDTGHRSGRKAAPRDSGTGSDASLDPLYDGGSNAAIDLDYDKVRRQAGPRNVGTRDAGTPKKRARRVRRTPARGGVAYKRSLAPWLLPILALAFLGYFLTRPSGVQVGAAAKQSPGAPRLPSPSIDGSSVADQAFKGMRMRIKQRRTGVAEAPAHMRDVVF